MNLPLVACVVCARPLDALLTSGLQAGVAVLALVAVAVVAGLVRGAVAVVRHDRLQQAGGPSRAPVETP
ncbi:MAG: hypothetical protein AB7O28_16720 [Vicinamibacterales bacterium]